MLTPEQARDLVDHFGGIRPAARATGVPRSTLYRSLRSKRARAADLRYWHRADGGYIKRRTRDLAVQRADVVSKLADLQRLRLNLERPGGRLDAGARKAPHMNESGALGVSWR